MDKDEINLSKLLPDSRDLNFGIILLCTYILFDFGAIQALLGVVSALKVPFLLALSSLLYAIILTLSGKVDFRSFTTKSFFLLCIFIIIYAKTSTLNPVLGSNILRGFLQFLANYVIMVSCVKKPSQYVIILDVLLLSIDNSCFHAIRQGGKIWGSIWLRDENHIALIAAMAIPFAFFLFMVYKSKLKRSFYVFSIALCVAANVVAMSRGGFLAMVGVGFFCWIFIKYKIRTLIIIAIAVICVFQLAPPKFFTEMNSIKEGTKEGTAFDRVYMWGIALVMFKDHPILGVGPFNFPEYYPEYNLRQRVNADRAPNIDPTAKRVAHSTPVQWLAELGIIGAGVLLLLQIPLFANWRTINKYKEIVKYETQKFDGFLFFKFLTHANAIAQFSFWISALFLSLMNYPFYWILIPLSETCKILFTKYMEENGEQLQDSSSPQEIQSAT